MLLNSKSATNLKKRCEEKEKLSLHPHGSHIIVAIFGSIFDVVKCVNDVTGTSRETECCWTVFYQPDGCFKLSYSCVITLRSAKVINI